MELPLALHGPPTQEAARRNHSTAHPAAPSLVALGALHQSPPGLEASHSAQDMGVTAETTRRGGQPVPCLALYRQLQVLLRCCRQSCNISRGPSVPFPVSHCTHGSLLCRR